ncbi:serine/arginine repetitive matrix protein 1-like [Eriocheir sinensis]|uniref:serine/arginine repetitive matrix protein 1-like n=1 Tax=Eriocheir sinensis TaxID=95602 RepID=UPI0021C9FE36|nr:serine/arginine repetitive matrix protein 1-like [Eriocheir sinensis]
MAGSSYAQGFPDSLEDSREAFRPSALFFDSPSSFRPVPRGGRNYDLSSSAVRSSSHAGYGPPPPKPKPASAYKPPSLSQTYGPPPPRPKPVSAYKPPSLSQTYGPPPPKPKPASAYNPPSLSQTYGPPPKPTPSTVYKGPSPTLTPLPRKPTPLAAFKPPSPTGSYSPSPKPTPRPVFGAPSPFPFDSRSRERFASSEFPHSSSRELRFGVSETIFGTSVERFDDSASSPRSFGGLNLRPLTFSRPRDTSSSRETASSPRSFGGLDFRPLSFSGLRDTSGSLHPTANIKPPLSISFVSSESLDSREFFGSRRGFFKPSSHLETPAKSFQPPHFGPLTPSDSRQSSSAELFPRTRDHPRPVVSPPPTQVPSVKTVRQRQTSSVGGHSGYHFNYDVNDSAEDDDKSFGGRRKKGPNFGHTERRDGRRTEGRYYVELPDGRTQVVEYYADETGYHPTVTYV